MFKKGAKLSKIVELLKISGYSPRAIEYYINKVNVGQIKLPSAHFVYTGPCGDTMEIFLKVDKGKILDASFQVIGCAGAFASASALCQMIKGKEVDEAKKITEENVIAHLGGLPKTKFHCTCLAKRTLEKAIEEYERRR